MPPAGMEHGDCGIEIAYLLKDFVKKHDLGKVYNADTGFKLSADTVRAPDIALRAQGTGFGGPWEGIRQGSAGSSGRNFLAVRQCSAVDAQGQAVLRGGLPYRVDRVPRAARDSDSGSHRRGSASSARETTLTRRSCCRASRWPSARFSLEIFPRRRALECSTISSETCIGVPFVSGVGTAA